MRMSGISSSRITSQKALTPFLIFVAISERNSPTLADVTHDSARKKEVTESARASTRTKTLSIEQHREGCLLSWFGEARLPRNERLQALRAAHLFEVDAPFFGRLDPVAALGAQSEE